jgi:Uma2 family endonuclease
MLVLVGLQKVFGDPFVDAGAPIDVHPAENTINEPVPDLLVLNRDRSQILSGNPKPQDIRLLVEISDSTLSYDLNVKGPLYARAGIVEYWILDTTGRRLIVHRNPVSGRYASVISYSEEELVAPLAAPDALFRAGQAFLVRG